MSTLITTLNPIDAIKREVVDLLKSRPFFANIDVLSDDKGDLDTTVATALQRLGLGVVFELESGRVKNPNLGAREIDLKATFTIVENVLINRDAGNVEGSGKTASDIVVELFAIFNPMASAVRLYLADFSLISNTGGVITYQVNGTVPAGWKTKE